MAITKRTFESVVGTRFHIGQHLFLLLLLTAIYEIAVVSFADYPLTSNRYLADPAGLEYNGRLYLYCSNDDDNTGNSYQMKSIACISTDDLKNWTDHGEVFRVPADASWATYSWAPSVVFRNSKFYLYFGNNVSSIGVASSTSPTGRFKDAKGGYLVNSSTPGASGTSQFYFDPCAFVDSSGQAYLYFGGNNASNARVIKLNSDMISVSGSATGFGSIPNFLEAAYMHKRNSTYYFSYETGGSVGQWIRYGTSSSPTSGFTWQGNVLQAPSNGNNNHQSFVSFNGVWYVAYHNRFVSGRSVYRRNVCLDRVNFNSDGTMQIVSCTTDNLVQLKNVNPYVQVQAETFNAQSGIETDVAGEGAMKLVSIANGDWVRIRGVDFGSSTPRTFSARVYSSATGGLIELRLGSTTGALIGTCTIPNTNGSWATASTSVNSVTGVQDLYLRFTGAFGGITWWQFSR